MGVEFLKKRFFTLVLKRKIHILLFIIFKIISTRFFLSKRSNFFAIPFFSKLSTFNYQLNRLKIKVEIQKYKIQWFIFACPWEEKQKRYKGTMPENMLRIGINILINITKLNRYNATNLHILWIKNTLSYSLHMPTI